MKMEHTQTAFEHQTSTLPAVIVIWLDYIYFTLLFDICQDAFARNRIFSVKAVDLFVFLVWLGGFCEGKGEKILVFCGNPFLSTVRQSCFRIVIRQNFFPRCPILFHSIRPVLAHSDPMPIALCGNYNGIGFSFHGKCCRPQGQCCPNIFSTFVKILSHEIGSLQWKQWICLLFWCDWGDFAGERVKKFLFLVVKSRQSIFKCNPLTSFPDSNMLKFLSTLPHSLP